MYAVTLDSQNITASELQSVYDEVAALKESATEENVYSEAYLGKLLSLAGKLYFAQIDIADTMAAQVYGVNSVRSLSEGITGYEVKTSSLYGNVTNLSEGNLFIDIDTDAHNVVSLTGDEDAPRAYMMATGMLSSAYEGIIWEQLTGYEAVSTMSVLSKAREDNIDILILSQENLSTEIEKLNTDETTKQTVINAVNSGMTVTIPAEDVTIGEWSGTGYIITNPETGTGAYMITGGLNGGTTTVITSIPVLLGSILSAATLEATMIGIVGLIAVLCGGGLTVAVTALTVLELILLMTSVLMITLTWISMLESYDEYLKTGDLEAAEAACKKAMWIGVEVALDMVLDVLIDTLRGKVPQGDNTPGGNGDADGDSTPGGNGDADGDSTPDGNGDADGDNKPDGDGDDGNSSDGDNDGNNTSDGNDNDGTTSDGDNGGSTGGKGDADGDNTPGGSGTTGDGGSTGGNGDVDSGNTSGGTGSDGGFSGEGGSYTEIELKTKAETAIQDLIASTSGGSTKSMAVGAYDLKKGKVIADFAGPIPDEISPILIERANRIGGIGSFGVTSKNTVGVCAEFRTINQLLLSGSDISDIRLTKAIRPRTGEVQPYCNNCLEMFSDVLDN